MAKKPKNFESNISGGKNIDVIAETILSRAQKLAESIKSDAKTSAEELIEQKRANIDAYCSKIISDAEAEAKKIASHAQMLSQMESRKIMQSSLSHILDRTFLDAQKNILKSEKYLQLVEGMIKKYAQKGDEVIISKNETQITEEFIEKLGYKLSGERGDFSGGIMLRGKIYDTNLTVDMLIRQIREENGAEIIKLVRGS